MKSCMKYIYEEKTSDDEVSIMTDVSSLINHSLINHSFTKLSKISR